MSISLSNTKDFKRVFTKYYPLLCFYVNSIINSEIDADDIVEDLFIKLWEQKITFNGEDNCKYYLYKSAKNLSINFLKQKQRTIEKHDQAYSLADLIEKDHSHALIKAEFLSQIISEIEKLPPQESKILLLTLKNGMGVTEIADLLGLSVQTVKNSKYRATQKMKQRLMDQNKFSLWIYLVVLYGL